VEESDAFPKKGHHTRDRHRGFAFGGTYGHEEDTIPPTMVQWFTMPGSFQVFAEIHDNVGVESVRLVVGKTAVPMLPWQGNKLWWAGVIPSIEGSTATFDIVARDYNNNTSKITITASTARPTSSQSQGAQFSISPLTVAGQQPTPAYSILASGINSTDPNANPQITIKNNGNEPLQNIRLMLSPELKGKFLLSEYAIKSIDPNSEYTVSLILNGNPNVNAMQVPIPYDGEIMVSVDNKTPYVLKLAGDIPNESSTLQSILMNMIATKAEQRYRTFETPDQRISQDTKFQVELASGDNAITNPTDELIITNTGNKPLKNVRIITSSLGSHFLLDQKNVATIPAGAFVKVQLVSKMNNVLSKDLNGELLIVPENGSPTTIPINISKRLADESNALFDIRTVLARMV